MTSTDPRDPQGLPQARPAARQPGLGSDQRDGYGDGATEYRDDAVTRQAGPGSDERGGYTGGASEYRGEAVTRQAGLGNAERGVYTGGATEYRDDAVTRRQPMPYESTGSDRNDRADKSDIPMRKVRETKPAFLTTEFWFAVGGIAALIAVYVIEDDPSLDLFRTALLATLIGVAYIVSRGLAKAGSRTTRQPQDPRLALEHSSR